MSRAGVTRVHERAREKEMLREERTKSKTKKRKRERRDRQDGDILIMGATKPRGRKE